MIACAIRWLALAASVSGPAAASAPGETPDELLDHAAQLFAKEADYAGALAKFRRANELRPSWRAANGMALSQQQLGRYVDALETCERILVEFGAELSRRQVATLDQRIVELRGRVAVVALDLRARGARLLVDGVEAGRGPFRGEVRLLPGRHAIIATLEGHKPFERDFDVRAGEKQELSITLERLAERVRVVFEEAPARFERRFSAWIPWASLGLSVVLLGTGGALLGSAASDFDDFDARVRMAAGPVPRQVDLARDGEGKQRAGQVLVATGAVAAVVATVLIVLNQPRLVREGAALGPASGGIVVRF